MQNERHNRNAAGDNFLEKKVAQSAAKDADFQEILIEKITVGKFCRRNRYNDIDLLAKSIEQNGLLQPGCVMDNGNGAYTLVFGSRRFEAHKRLNKQTFRCRVIKATPEQAAVMSFQENSTIEKIHPVEQARKLRSMMKTFGWTEEQVAKRIGWKQNTVSEHIGILDLDKGILARVDTRSESPFKFTHAQILSKLKRSGRANAEMEVQQLFNKTTKHRLPCSELKALVHLIRNRQYDHLPKRLREHLLKTRAMTSAVARLYLQPDSIVEGKSESADERRKLAKNMDKMQLGQLIRNAVKAGWTFDKTKQGLQDLIERQSRPVEQRGEKFRSRYEKLCEGISIMTKRLKTLAPEIPGLARSNPNELDILCKAIAELRDKLNEFERSVRSTLDEHEGKQRTSKEIL